MDKVEYLSHFIFGKKVETDPQIVASIVKWPIFKTVKSSEAS